MKHDREKTNIIEKLYEINHQKMQPNTVMPTKRKLPDE